MANRKLLKRMIPIFYSISVHVIKSNAARIDRQDDRKGLIAVDIDRLFGVAIINLKLLHLLLIHGNQCALISTLCGEFLPESPRVFRPRGRNIRRKVPGD